MEETTAQAPFANVPREESSPENRKIALHRLKAIQKEVGDRLRAAGKSEHELDRILSEESSETRNEI